jgi:membrane-bound metal-dependent hydrolase YbcI (DUF457 family)
MTLVTHALLPLAVGRPWLRRRDGSPLLKEIGLVALCGILPDVLSPHIYLEARYASLSHTLWAWFVFTALVLLVGRVWKARICPRIQILCIAAYAMHLACDMISGGIPLFYPLSRTIHGGHFISYIVWYVSDVLLFLHAWLVWRVLPRLRKRTAPAWGEAAGK